MDCCSVMAAEDCECASISEFVLECSRIGANMKSGWRKPGLCRMQLFLVYMCLANLCFFF